MFVNPPIDPNSSPPDRSALVKADPPRGSPVLTRHCPDRHEASGECLLSFAPGLHLWKSARSWKRSTLLLFLLETFVVTEYPPFTRVYDWKTHTLTPTYLRLCHAFCSLSQVAQLVLDTLDLRKLSVVSTANPFSTTKQTLPFVVFSFLLGKLVR